MSPSEPASSAELAAWLKLCSIPGLGGESQRKLMQAFGLPEQVLAMGYTAWRSVIGAKAELLLDNTVDALVDQSLEWATQPSNTILALNDPRYPAALLDIPDPPSLLYVRGNLAQLEKPGIAIVGSRNASTQGRQTAKAFASTLSEVGYSVISGLAMGIDAAAHEGALESQGNGKTLAVIGTGADRLYPARNRALAERIVAEGVVVSEFALGTPALPANFPRRNRIIAGLSRGVLVVEAALESGSLVTARLAIEQGREVMAIPGSIHSPLTKGCHRLIKQGAKLVETVDDVLEEIGYLAKSNRRQPTNKAASAPPLSPELVDLLKAVAYEPTSFDTIVTSTGLSTQEALGQLLQLEMQGWIVATSGDCYQRTG
ncbi:MAG: DNA-protecting protein DprA [Pseudomonadota bacterium]|jgi:DNA processing protein